jgi:hypothetical protein
VSPVKYELEFYIPEDDILWKEDEERYPCAWTGKVGGTSSPDVAAAITANCSV